MIYYWDSGLYRFFRARSIVRRNLWRNYVGGMKSIINGDKLILFRKGKIDNTFLERKRKEHGRGRYVLHDLRIVELYKEFRNRPFQFDYICDKCEV